MKIEQYTQASTLWLEYQDKLRYYLLSKTKDAELAKDLTQEVLLKIYNSCCSGNEIANVKSWLFQVAHNTFIDHVKKDKKSFSEILELVEEKENTFYKEGSEVILPLMKLIPQKYSEPLIMADIMGWKQQQIATELNLTLPATKSRIQRARKLLKETIMYCCNIEKDTDGCLDSIEIRPDCKVFQIKE